MANPFDITRNPDQMSLADWLTCIAVGFGLALALLFCLCGG